MSHDLRQALGYRNLPTSDPKEAAMRSDWYAARKKRDEEPNDMMAEAEFRRVDSALCAYLWQRCEAEIAEDRRKHPKARRNQPVPKEGVGDGRVLP